ncbi:hypothetical protein EV363DRAFT_1299128 [Boletus edulis]|nr:hypothetical protein EV363DRAFT_1299128 [Boletus edulis]
MERSRKIFHEIACAADKVITTATKFADRKDSWSVGHSHFQLDVEMQRISIACACIADILAKSVVPGGPEFDVRLQDWLATDEPEQCRDTLIRMEMLLQVQKDKSSWVSRIFRREGDKAPTGDKIKEAVEHFISRKGCFYFLSLTEIWNDEKNVRQQPQDNVTQLESDVPNPGSSDGICAKTNFIMPDPAVHQGGRAGHILVPDQMDLNSTIPGTAVQQGRDTARHERQETMFHEQWEKEAKILEEITKWLDGLNCGEKQDNTLALRQPDTCKWLFDTAQYKMWRDGGKSFLWLRGKRKASGVLVNAFLIDMDAMIAGAGKSVLASSVISSLETSLRKGEILAFFYCDFRSERSTSSAEALRSILSQLLCELHDRTVIFGSLLDDLVKAKKRGGFTRNNTKELAVFASRVAMLSNEKPLVIVDALDECNDVTSLLQALMQIKDHIRLFVTSRPLHVIICGLSGLPFISMDDMEDELSTDIELHVTRELDARHRLRDIDTVFKAEIRSVLCGKAGGMFRWIQCSIDTLDRCVTRKEVRSALDSLPEGLDGTYERILLAIDMKRREGQLARRALTWLVAALRPLQLSELIEGLSINLETRTLDLDFGPMHNGVLLDACGSLVIYNEKTGIIILSHFSVKEYLMGELILKKLPQYYIDWERAHMQLARSCMCYLTVYLNSPPIIDPVSERREHLRDYVLHDAINHFRPLGSQFESVLPDIKLMLRTRFCGHSFVVLRSNPRKARIP